MKFKYGDTAVYKDGFAEYVGIIRSHQYIKPFFFFWKKESWYELEVLHINGDFYSGMLFVPEKLLKTYEDPKKKKTKTKTSKVTELRPLD